MSYLVDDVPYIAGFIADILSAVIVQPSLNSLLGWCGRVKHIATQFRSGFNCTFLSERATKIICPASCRAHGDDRG